MKKICVLFVSLLFHAAGSFAQDCHCTLSDQFRKNQRQSEQFDLQIAIDSLVKGKNTGCEIRSLEWKAEQLYTQRSFDSAAFYLEREWQQLRKNSCKEESFFSYYRHLSFLYFLQGEYTRSLEYSLKLLPLTEQSGDRYEEALCLLQVAQTFNKMKESAKGMEYARKAGTMLPGIRIPMEKAALLSRLASAYFWRFQDTKNKTLLDSAKAFSLEQIQVSRENGFRKQLVKAYSMMNGYAHETGDYPTALKYIDSSFFLGVRTGDIALQATAYGDKADVLMEMGEYREARRLADSCLALQQLNKSPETIANAYALIYQISMRSEQYKEAVDAMNSYIEIQDSLTNAEKSKTINELEQKYNKAKNEKTIRELAQQKRIYILLAVAGLFALIGLAFFIRQQSLKSKQKILETEQRLNRARMNPHFFFNALSSLQGFALEGHDGKSIATNLSKFSHIMRETLESTYKEYMSIEEEAGFLRQYLELQQIRYPDKFTFSISIADDIDSTETMIPFMILQPFAENSIEHGFSGIGYPGKIDFRFEQEGKDLIVQIADNGKGLTDLSGENKSTHISRASQIIRDRIYLLNAKHKTRASFSIENNSETKGVTVLIRLPLLYSADLVN